MNLTYDHYIASTKEEHRDGFEHWIIDQCNAELMRLQDENAALRATNIEMREMFIEQYTQQGLRPYQASTFLEITLASRRHRKLAEAMVVKYS